MDHDEASITLIGRPASGSCWHGVGYPLSAGAIARNSPSSPPSWMDASVKQSQGREPQRKAVLQGGCQFNDAAQAIVTSDLRRAIYELNLGTKISTGWG